MSYEGLVALMVVSSVLAVIICFGYDSNKPRVVEEEEEEKEQPPEYPPRRY